jgi:hypothetical protein
MIGTIAIKLYYQHLLTIAPELLELALYHIVLSIHKFNLYLPVLLF